MKKINEEEIKKNNKRKIIHAFAQYKDFGIQLRLTKYANTKQKQSAYSYVFATDYVVGNSNNYLVHSYIGSNDVILDHNFIIINCGYPYKNGQKV